MKDKETEKAIKNLWKFADKKLNFKNLLHYCVSDLKEIQVNLRIVFAYVLGLEKEIIVLENTKNTCPFMATSGIECVDKKDKEYVSKQAIRNKKKEHEQKRDFYEINMQGYSYDRECEIIKEYEELLEE